MSTAGDRVRVSVRVEVPRDEAFRTFVEDIDLWWRRGLAYRVSGRGRGVLVLEPRVGGRLLEEVESPRGARVFESGRVRVYAPPERLVFSWRAVNFAPDEETEVEVRFDAQEGSTLVTVEHRGWAKLRADHPVRHGAPPDVFVRAHGQWWGQLLTSLRHHVEGRGG